MADADFVVYTLGDTSTYEGMLQGVALLFQDPFYSGDAAFGLGYGVLLGVLILFTLALYQSALKQKFDLRMLIMPFIFYVMLTMPKTTVTIVDSFNQEPSKQVANVPIGLALPLTFASSISQNFTESMETAYSTPNSPRLLVDGFVSPLKTLYALRYVNISEESPYIAAMINIINEKCIVGNSLFDPNEYKTSPDSYRYFINFLNDKARGVVSIKDIDGSVKTLSCQDAASELQRSFEAFVYGDGTKNGTLNFNFKRALNGAIAMNGGSGSFGKIQDYNDVINNFAQITNLTANDGRQFMLNTLFNQPLQSASYCSNNKGSQDTEQSNLAHCGSWITSDAQLAEDNAAAASGFMRMLQDGQNILIILAILLFPMVVIMIVYMGPKSVMVVSSYCMYLASVYLWMPMASIVNYYSYVKLQNTIAAFSGSSSGDLFSIADYPAFYQAVSDSLSLANGLTAILPIFCMMFFSGMTMAMVGFMRRMDASKTSNYDPSMNVPTVISPSPFANRSSLTTSNGLGAVTDTRGGKAFTLSASQSFEASATQMVALQKQKSMLESKAQSLTAQISSADSVTVGGSNTETHLSNMHGSQTKEVLEGNGYTQQIRSFNKGQIATDGTNSTISSDETDRKALVNQNGIVTSLGIGITAGKGSAIKSVTLPEDGSGLANAGTNQIEPTGGSNNAYKLGPIEVKLGSTNVVDARYMDSDIGKKTGKKDTVIYSGSGQNGSGYSDNHYDVLKRSNYQQTLNGSNHSVDKQTNRSSSDSDQLNRDYKESLTKNLAQTHSQIEEIKNSIANISALSLSVSMLDTDVLHRVARHESIRNDLERIDRENSAKFGSKWEDAKQLALHQAQFTSLATAAVANSEELPYYAIVMAGMNMNYDTANATYKALTGLEAQHSELDGNLRSANTDWNAFNLDGQELRDAHAQIFGARPTLDHQYSYLAGELNVHGGKQQQNMIMVYNSFLHAGFTPKQASVLTAEVGRENSFNSASLYGTHYDPAKQHITNGGMISFNQDRKVELDTLMMQKGLVTKGKIGSATYVESQESLDAMAKFMYKELSTNGRYSTAWAALNNDSLSKDEVHYAVGKNYIVWRIDDKDYQANGIKNRKTFGDMIEKELINQSKAKFEQSPLGDVSTASFGGSNNLSLKSALSNTGLKGQLLGDGLVDNKFIANAGLRIKAPKHDENQAYGGGKSRGYTVEFAHLAQQQLGSKIKYFTGFNDEYHQNVGSTGKHVQGRAFDLVLTDPKYANAAIAEMQKLAKQHGYKVAFENEYASKSKDFTGQHLHVSVLGRTGGGVNLNDQAITARIDKSAKLFNEAVKTQDQHIEPVRRQVNSLIPVGHGKGEGRVTNEELQARHVKATAALTDRFNKDVERKYGIGLSKDKNGEDIKVDVKDLGKVARATVVDVVNPIDHANSIPENAKAAWDKIIPLPSNYFLDREAAKVDERKASPYSDFNNHRQKQVDEARKIADAKLNENTGLNRNAMGQERRATEEKNDQAIQQLKDEIRNSDQRELDRRFKVVQKELQEHPVERDKNPPASRNAALVSASRKDDSPNMLTADNLTAVEAINRYNANRKE